MLTKYSYENIADLNKNFDGWFAPDESKILYDLAKNLNTNGAIVEIGSWCGKSLSFFIAATLNAQISPKIYSIDPYLTSKDQPNDMYKVFVANMKQLDFWNKFTQIKEKSQIVGKEWNTNISLLFIDGFHRYDAVRQDFDLFFPHILNNGYCVLHDILSWLGPTDLTIELLHSNTQIKFIDFKDSSLVLQKTDCLTKDEFINNQNVANMINTKAKEINLIK